MFVEGKTNGNRLCQNYELVKLIAERPLYSAFLAYDHHTSQHIMIKIFDSTICGSLGKYCAFNEFNVLNYLDHPSIIKAKKIFEFSIESEDYLAIVEDYVQGEFLCSYLQNNYHQAANAPFRQMSEKEIIDIGIQICDILIYFDNKNNRIRHRDIRPDNFIVQPDGKLKLVDAEIAAFPKSQNALCKFFRMGSLGYTSPTEYSEASYTISKWQTDTYSVGATMYALSTGTDIFGNTIFQPVHKINQNISTDLYKIISKCMKPGGYKDAKKLKKALLKCGNK